MLAHFVNASACPPNYAFLLFEGFQGLDNSFTAGFKTFIGTMVVLMEPVHHGGECVFQVAQVHDDVIEVLQVALG